MSLSNYDFSQDTRQSKVAIILLIWKYYKLVFRQLLVFIIPLFFAQNKSTILIFIIGSAIVTILVFTMAILAYYRFFFRIENNELVISKGVFKKTKLNIPFERIQTINFEQNLILQVLQRYKVEVDTAGSSKKEFSFDALNMDVAKQMRQKILERKKLIKIETDTSSNLLTGTHEQETIVYEELEEPEEENILKLSGTDLFKIGITENHLKAGAWLIAIMGYAFSSLSEAGLDVEEQIVNSGIFKNLDPGLALFLSAIPSLVALLVGISVVRIFLKYFNLQFNRIESGFKIFSGLLNVKEHSAPDHKIQKVAWGDNPLKRLFGINILWLKQARSNDNDRNKSISIPIIKEKSINAVLQYLYDEKLEEDLHQFPISKHFFWRNLIFLIGIPTLIICVVALIVKINYLFIIAAIYLIYFSITTYVQYRKAAFSLNSFMIKRSKGIYGNHRELVPWYKVQVVEIKQSIYQRRNNLANIYFHTAAGEMMIPYIDIEQARKLRDYALYMVESSTKEWM